MGHVQRLGKMFSFPRGRWGPFMALILTIPRALWTPLKCLHPASKQGTARARQIGRLLGARLEGVGSRVALARTQHSAWLWVARGKGNDLTTTQLVPATLLRETQGTQT